MFVTDGFRSRVASGLIVGVLGCCFGLSSTAGLAGVITGSFDLALVVDRVTFVVVVAVWTVLSLRLLLIARRDDRVKMLLVDVVHAPDAIGDIFKLLL